MIPNKLIIRQPLAPGYCNKESLIGTTYVNYECATDGQSITKKIYSDSNCSLETGNSQIYNSTDRLENGDLHDFNCVGKENVVAYDAYLSSCDIKIETAYLATDICYNYLNETNITNDKYPNISSDVWYQLSQENKCEKDVVTVNTYINKGCDKSPGFETPLSSFTANGKCSNFFEAARFEVYAKVRKCIKDGVDTFE